MIDLSNVDIISRIKWGSDNLKPFQTDYRIVYEDPGLPDQPAMIVVPTGEWMACALNGGILPSIDDFLNIRFELQTEDGEKFEGDYIEAQKIRLEKNITEEKVIDYNKYLMSKPIGPMTEEEAIEYLLMKDVPARVWHSEYKYNRPMFKICKKDQIPQNRTYRDAWRLKE